MYVTDWENEHNEEYNKIAQQKNGVVAQLGEHLPCTQGVGSSILPGSTINFVFFKQQRII
jgi:hypothetical protein